FYIEHVRQHGSVPQWNPYIFCGLPYVEAFHGDIFYPLSILKFFGSIYRMLGINLFLHIFLAGIFMYFTARQFKLSKMAALMSSVCYMFAPYLVSLVAPGHDGKIFVTSLFPLVILFLDRMFEKNALLNATLLGLVLGVTILSPHPQMSYFTLWAAGAFTLFRLIVLYRSSKTLAVTVRPAVMAVYAVIIGLLLSAIQFYPGYIYTSEFSPRADSKSGWEWATSWSMHEEEAFSLVVPEFSGTNSSKANSFYWGKNNFKDNSESVGTVALFAALIGLFFSRRKEAYFFGGLAILALLYALGATTPVFKLFYYLVPKVKSLRAPSMIMFLFSFATAILAGMALQRLIDQRRDSSASLGKRFHYLVLGWPGLLIVLALLFGVAGRGLISMWLSVFYPEAANRLVQKGVSRADIAYQNLSSIATGAWLAFLFVGLAALLIWFYWRRRGSIGLLAAVVVLPVIDGVRFDSRFVSTFDPNQAWASTPLTDFFKRQQGEFRVMNLAPNLQADILPYHGIEVVTGYHGNQLRWFDELLGGLDMRNQLNPRFLNLVGARFFVTPSNRQFPPGYFGEKPVSIAANFGQIQVVQNENAFPRVYLVDRYRLFADRKEVHEQVVGGTDNLREIVYLEQEPNLSVAADSLSGGGDSAWVVEHAIDSVIVGLSCSRNQILVLTDNYYDAWQVFVDGAPASLLRAYGTFRAVAIPAGSKHVLFKYESPRYRTGRLVTWLTAVYVAAVLAISLVRGRRRRSARESERP
ncbi:MAG TPA: hypothetical protein VN285_03155, partial [Candidatus Deferrimicrobium sp.]|nr:hypothetical protein [Candidatus Deferrimicrobium sp.]